MRIYFQANDKASRGTWVHASTNIDVTWFPYKMVCGNGDIHQAEGGDTLLSQSVGPEQRLL